jgi:hypothetical protein
MAKLEIRNENIYGSRLREILPTDINRTEVRELRIGN